MVPDVVLHLEPSRSQPNNFLVRLSLVDFTNSQTYMALELDRAELT